MGLQDPKSTVAVVQHLITKLQSMLQLGLTQNILPSVPSLANKIW